MWISLCKIASFPSFPERSRSGWLHSQVVSHRLWSLQKISHRNLPKNQCFRLASHWTIAWPVRSELTQINCTWMRHWRWNSSVARLQAAHARQDLHYPHIHPTWTTSQWTLESCFPRSLSIMNASTAPSQSIICMSQGRSVVVSVPS